LEEKRPGVFGPKPAKRAQRKASQAPASATKAPKRARLGGLISGFRDRRTRPRYILVTGAIVIGIAMFMIVALGVTSTRWFCSEGCHKVQDDTILAYEHSTHSEISCMACHMPVRSDPITFILHKAEALGELYLTATNQYELPLNAESHVGLTMPSEQCTQCHELANRVVTPSQGVLIDHDIHAENGVTCAICHNRVAHDEDFQLTLNDPATGEPNTKHEVFMSMTACFRCHTQQELVAAEEEEERLTATGACAACHPEDFQLKPEYHLEEDFFPEKHGDLAATEASRVIEAAHEETGSPEGASSEESEGEHGSGGVGESLPPVAAINECNTCHSEKFCSDCHGLPMPHPVDFRQEHAAAGEEAPQSCVMCHGPADRFCDDCHHGTTLGREVDQSREWLPQHMDTVRETGASVCFECHNPTYCANCHVEGGQ
jgi:nitrate/TMAO reductase-like tetraheme cytochrome c subunit